jgi:hypothetical protein
MRREETKADIKLLIENVRTFSGRHDIPVRPLTILTGENSSGKTTFLACLSCATAEGFPFDPGFNEEPYRMGGFELIVSKAGDFPARGKRFSLGITLFNGTSSRPTEITSTFRNENGSPTVAEVELFTALGDARVVYVPTARAYRATLTSNSVPSQEIIFPFEVPKKEGKKEDFRSSLYSQLLSYSVEQTRERKPVKSDLLSLAAEIASHPVRAETGSVAPSRTKPWRTYDPAEEFYDPEGDHIPFVLARTLADSSSDRGRLLRQALTAFGRESALFDHIEVRNLGKRGEAPFQIQVFISGKPISLQDVGYGVSQSLPVLVESVLAPATRLLLVQQPEVHLHPMAQAALGSFFARMVGLGEKRFVIETHSDYLVDRVRQEVAKGTVDHTKVVILYFDRVGLKSRVYPLELDALGNIMGTPPGYREFFLREELSLLTR